MTQQEPQFYEFGEYRLDAWNRLLVKGGQFVDLRPKVVDLLVALIEKHGQLVEKDLLMKRVWGDTNVDEGNLTQTIRMLRKELGHATIKNVPRRGYRFVAEVREVASHEARRASLALPAEPQNPETEQDEVASWPGEPPDIVDLPAPPRPKVRRGVITVVILVLGALVLWGLQTFRPPHTPFVHRIPPETGTYYDAYGGRISPDGKRVAFLARSQSSGKRLIFVQELARDEEAEAIDDTAGDFTPFFWSHDGKSLYFVTENLLKRKRLGQPSIDEITSINGAPRGTVNQDGVVLLSSSDGILRVLPDGQVARVTLSNDASAHTAPYFLPDGRTFLFLAISHSSDGPQKMLWSARLDVSEPPRRIGPVPSRVEWIDGHLLYARDGALYARPFSLETLAFSGGEILVTRRVWSTGLTSDADFSVARNGLLIVKDAASRSKFLRVGPDKSATSIPWEGQVVGISVARARELAVLAAYPTPGRTDLWVWDLKSDAKRKLTTRGTNTSPVLNDAGDEVYFAADRTNFASIYRMSTVTGEETLVLKEDGARNPRGLSPDGQQLLYASYVAQDSDLYCINLKSRQVTAIANSPNAMEGETGRFSPDGTRIVYVSDVTGERRVYWTAFPPANASAQAVSQSGGWRARWSHDGTKIYYLLRRKVMEYDVRTQATREVFEAESDISHMEPTSGGGFLIVIAPVEPPNRIFSNWRDARSSRLQPDSGDR